MRHARGRVVGVAAALMGSAILVVGCGGGGGIPKDTFIDGFVTKSGLTRDQAVCVTDRLFGDLSESEIRTIHDAEDWEVLSPKEQRAIVSASTSCLTPEGGSGSDAPPATGTGEVTPTGTDGPATTESSDTSTVAPAP